MYVVFSFLFISMAHCHQSHHGSHHPQPEKPQMHNSKMAQDINHVTEHLKEKIDVKRDLTPEEIEFFYFMEHDFNNDSRLDGLEILSAIKHSDLAKDLQIDTSKIEKSKQREAFNMEVNYYTDIIDEILKEDDLNNDGYLSYLEYSLARRRDELEEAKQKAKKKAS
ncbi:unnamed protein product [Brachionus calyciflorus]|uniref:EF-hand domain-containing protein n=1 Tax=Brachionus calyciflorus TaxID=104777 RepID=A0A813ZIB3_9BILA|nr:unnamed protein product [Brachionus calyciflorus]